MRTVTPQTSAIADGDNLDRLLALLEAARAADAARRRVDPRTAWRALLAAVERDDPTARAA